MDIITISREKTDLFENVLEKTRKNLKDNPLVVVVLHGILEYILNSYKIVVSDLEIELLKMEAIPRSQIPSDFLERTFQLKKEITALNSNLQHLKEILGLIVAKRVPLEGFTPAWQEMFGILKETAIYLHEASDKAKENLISIIDLHINRNSYETNKVLKILAIITALGILPSVVSGLLGENISDLYGGNFFPVYLWEIVSFLGLGMIFILYIFIKLGWMRS